VRASHLRPQVLSIIASVFLKARLIHQHKCKTFTIPGCPAAAIAMRAIQIIRSLLLTLLVFGMILQAVRLCSTASSRKAFAAVRPLSCKEALWLILSMFLATHILANR